MFAAARAPRTAGPTAASGGQQQQSEGATMPMADSSSNTPHLDPSSATAPSSGGGEGAGAGGAAEAAQAHGVRGWIGGMMADNPYFSAGFGLMGVGAGLAILRRVMTLGAGAAQRRMLISLEIPSKDRSYPWFLQWMSEQARQQARSPSRGKGIMGLGRGDPGPEGVIIKSHELSVETVYKQHDNGSSEAQFILVPGLGMHWFKYKGAWMRLRRERDGKTMDLVSGTPWETVTLTTLFSDAHLFPQLLEDARRLAMRSMVGKTVIYTAWGPEWRPFGLPRSRRDLKSVVLRPGLKEKIVEDVQNFLNRGHWYAERGIPYRRGYLLHGPPGSGKSSFISALAGSLDFNICVLNLSERGLNDDKLNHLLANAPERSIILLEDVDAAFNTRVQTSEDGYQSAVTFSGLLNSLDGVASGESRIIFMTTNHPERLDPALVRPGRVDITEEIGNATKEQVETLTRNFYSAFVVGEGDSTGAPTPVGGPLTRTELDQLATSLSAKVERVAELRALGRMDGLARAVSMAELQGHFIRYPEDPRGAVETFGEDEDIVVDVDEGRGEGEEKGSQRKAEAM